jgi:hypothetical protein
VTDQYIAQAQKLISNVTGADAAEQAQAVEEAVMAIAKLYEAAEKWRLWEGPLIPAEPSLGAE